MNDEPVVKPDQDEPRKWRKRPGKSMWTSSVAFDDDDDGEPTIKVGCASSFAICTAMFMLACFVPTCAGCCSCGPSVVTLISQGVHK